MATLDRPSLMMHDFSRGTKLVRPPPSPLRALRCPHTGPCAHHFQLLPPEIRDLIFKSLEQVLDQLHLALALVPGVGRAEAMTSLIETVKDDFFLDPQIAKHMFGPGGIKGHGARYPNLKPKAPITYEADGEVTGYRTLIHRARRQYDHVQKLQLLEDYNPILVAYRRKAAGKTQRIREGLKPRGVYKQRVGLSMKDKRTYVQLKAAFVGQNTLYAAIKDAEKEEMAEELRRFKNFEIVEELCKRIVVSSSSITDSCVGCMEESSILVSTAHLGHRFCTSCRDTWVQQAMIDSPFLNVIQRNAWDMFVKHISLWFDPVKIYKNGHTTLYFTKKEAESLRAMLDASDDDAMNLECHAASSLLYDAVRIKQRFRVILQAVVQAAAQCRKCIFHVDNSWFSTRRETLDLSSYGLPEWIMSWYSHEKDLKVDTIEYAEVMVRFFARVYGAEVRGTGRTGREELTWQKEAVSAFWREQIQMRVQDQGMASLHSQLFIRLKDEFHGWMDPKSCLHLSNHPIDRTNALCYIIHNASPSDVLKAPKESLQRNVDRFQVLSAVACAALHAYDQDIVRAAMLLLAHAFQCKSPFDGFLSILSHWWRGKAPVAIGDRLHPGWSQMAAAGFWEHLHDGQLSTSNGVTLNVLHTIESQCRAFGGPLVIKVAAKSLRRDTARPMFLQRLLSQRLLVLK